MDLISFITGYVFDKGGRCLRTELIRALVENRLGMGEIFNVVEYTRIGDKRMTTKVYSEMDEKVRFYEATGFYATCKGLTFERSTMTNRIIYKYTEEVQSTDLIDIDGLTNKFSFGASIEPTETGRISIPNRLILKKRVCIKDERRVIRSMRQGIGYPGQ
jgi:hypothetical protein